MTSKALVVARYNEDVSWVNALPDWNCFVYNKGEPYPGLPAHRSSPNVGREAHTYLQWIVTTISEDDDLPDEVVLCQGRPFDHDPNFLVHLLDDSVRHYGIVWDCPSEGELQMTMIGPGLLDEYCRVFGLPVQPRYRFSTGAQYRVTREQILSRPLAFYEALLAITKFDPVAPYRLERLFPLIFGIKL